MLTKCYHNEKVAAGETHSLSYHSTKSGSHVASITSGQSNLTESPHRHRTWIAQLYSPGGDNLHPHLMRASLGPLESICSAVFEQLTAESPYTLQWAAPFPSKLPFRKENWTPSNTWFPVPTGVHNPFLQGSRL